MRLPSLPSPLRLLCAALGASALSLTSASAQTTASTDPVGFITITIPGTSTGGGSSQLSFQGLGLVLPVVAQGTSTAVGTNTITDTSASWTDNQFNGSNGSFYVEITGPTGASGIGTTYDISATTAATSTITLAQNLASGITAGATYRIRQHWTIGNVFSSSINNGGLNGGTSTTADQVLLYNPASGTYTTYYYSNSGLAGTGWRITGTTDQSGTILFEDSGIIINRKQSGAASVTLMGAVKTGQTSTPVVNGLNILSNPYAASMTLGNCGLYTDSTGTTGVKSGSASTADQVLIFNPSTGTYTTYYYSSGGLAGLGWRSVGSTDQSAVSLPVGSSFLVVRKASTAFNWVAPQTPASF